jgi:orotate phosphoribosyltransferase
VNSEEARTRLLEILLERSFEVGSFTLASGRKSDYYIDCRTTTLHPEGAYLIAMLFLDRLKSRSEETGRRVDAVGGLTLGADPVVGALISQGQVLGMPLRGFIVRKEAKGHGKGKQVEGCLEKNDNVAIIEDVVTTGGSALKAIAAAEGLGAKIVEVMAVVDREEGGREALADKGYELFSLFTTSELKAAKSGK